MRIERFLVFHGTATFSSLIILLFQWRREKSGAGIQRL